jgi:hypothetical protein
MVIVVVVVVVVAVVVERWRGAEVDDLRVHFFGGGFHCLCCWIENL